MNANALARTFVLLGGLLSLAAGARAESASVLLQKGLFAEQTKGDLDAAMKIYRKILDEARTSTTALLLLKSCDCFCR